MTSHTLLFVLLWISLHWFFTTLGRRLGSPWCSLGASQGGFEEDDLGGREESEEEEEDIPEAHTPEDDDDDDNGDEDDDANSDE